MINLEQNGFIKFLLIFLLLLMISCGKKGSSSYHYSEKMIEYGDLSFHNTIRVDEYINAFKQNHIMVPSGEDVAMLIAPIISQKYNRFQKNYVQIAIKTRHPNSKETSGIKGITFILDISGSMHDDNKIKILKDAMQKTIYELNDNDIISIILFNNSAKELIVNTKINSHSRNQIQNLIKSIKAGGGTNITDGLLYGCKVAKNYNQVDHRQILLLTDGQSNILKQQIDPVLVEMKSDFNTRVSTIGLGYEVDENILREIASQGSGQYYFAENAKELYSILNKGLNSATITIAENAKLTIEPAHGVKLRNTFGTNPEKTDSFNFDLGDLNVNEWQIVLLEIDKTKIAYGNKLFSANLTYKKTNSGKTFSINESYNLSKKNPVKAEDKIYVNNLRNSIAFGNALALIQVGKYFEEGSNNAIREAYKTIELQKNNNIIFLSKYNSKEMQHEVERFNDIQKTLEQIMYNQDIKYEKYVQFNLKEDYRLSKNDMDDAVMKGVKIAADLDDGIWVTISEIFKIMNES